MKHRLTAVAMLFFAMLLLCSIASCSEKPAAQNTVSATSAAETEETAAETAPNYTEMLPNEDYEGYAFTMLTRDAASSWGQVSFDAEALNGEVINDTVFSRNSNVEERYNITIANTENNAPATVIKKLVLAGSDEYDFMSDYVKIVLETAGNGYYYNLNNVSTMDFSKPWWSSECAEELAIEGKLFVAFNAMSTQLVDLLYCNYFNNDIVKDFSLESPYDLVRSGKWTMDKFNEMSMQVVQDLNGDGVMNADDRFGYVTGVGSFNAWTNAANQPHIRYDSSGNIVLNYGSERAIAAAEKIASIINADYSVYLNEDPWGSDVFNSGNALFCEGSLFTFGKLREFDPEFGVTPPPKFDENQENYRAMMSNCSLGVTIPFIAADPERTGVITEALGAYSLGVLDEAYYEITLKGKYTRDDDSMEMIDIIKNSQIVDLGVLNENAWGNIIKSWLTAMRKSGAETVASLAESNQEMFDTTLAKIVEAYASIG